MKNVEKIKNIYFPVFAFVWIVVAFVQIEKGNELPAAVCLISANIFVVAGILYEQIVKK